MLLFTLIIGLVGLLIFNWIQKTYQNSNVESEINNNLPNLDQCIKHRQCLDQIKKIKVITDQQDIGIYILKTLSHDIIYKIIMTNRDHYITKKFKFLNNDETTIIGKACFSMIKFKEIGQKIDRLYDHLNINYTDNSIYNINPLQYNYDYIITDINFVYRNCLNKFKINSLEHINNYIIIRVSNNYNDEL